MLATSSYKLRSYCFRNPEITLENLLIMQRLEKMQKVKQRRSKDVQRCRRYKLHKKIKKQIKTDERAKGKGKYFGRKSSRDTTQKTYFRCGGSYPRMAQCPAIGKSVSTGQIQVMGNR